DFAARLGRRRPFSALMKKLANLKATSYGDGGRHSNSKRGGAKKQQNNPYPLSGRVAIDESPRYSRYSGSPVSSRRRESIASLERADSVRISGDEHPPPTMGGRSIAPTISTVAPSCGESSLATGSRTVTGRRGGDSTFSSPAPSVRSLTTTLTTIQTITPNPGGSNQHHHTTANHHNANSQAIHFNQPFPSSTGPISAIPAHLSTYHSATANNILTDNASILTLASSSKRHRRRGSLDEDASTRALAPSSLWGGSRESLPLSVLSATLDGTAGGGGAGGQTTPGLHRGASIANERTSIYSATGIYGTAAGSDRNSFYAKQGFGGGGGGGVGGGDAASVRSGLLGHGRADSVSGSICGGGGGLGVPASGTSPLASPREVSESEGE
ncbi:hypothetical protein N658DRAFT_400392, partial [Parathielavia hyrcaniae]